MAIYVGGLRAGDVIALTVDCDLGALGERAVVLDIGESYMTLVFPNRDQGYRVVQTVADYKFLRRV